MKCQSRNQVIGVALAPILMLGLSACLPPSTEGLRPDQGSSAATQGTSQQLQPTIAAPTTAHPREATDPAVSAAPASSSAPEPAGAPTTSGGPQADAQVVQWLPAGPIGPNDPVSGQRYLLLQQFQCDALAQSLEGAEDAAVWQAGAAVCRAVQSGSQQDWQRASKAVGATPQIPQSKCLEFRVAITAASLLAQHRTNPQAAFNVQPGQGEACPRQLVGLTVVDEELNPLPGTTRATGPSTGGTIVRLDGYYVHVSEVLFDGVPADVDFVGDRHDYGTVYLRMPPAQGRDSVRISITDTVEVAGTVTFFYEDSGQSTGTRSPSEPTRTSPATQPPDALSAPSTSPEPSTTAAP
ncbi:hypothetical protein LRQ04_18155 [Paenarthrobacter sp. AR 02]|uniref:hypothetical protein n=1 Tax=Paenarthrobacter sp. AR 02 TaxID=2899821 RepID=UPI001F408773|nr:hypothetical protein [Paenarthrobacter sp. AR 02]MCF3141177.1 hypothetical protein [Paenarthrobacter sp. AR 02]